MTTRFTVAVSGIRTTVSGTLPVAQGPGEGQSTQGSAIRRIPANHRSVVIHATR